MLVRRFQPTWLLAAVLPLALAACANDGRNPADPAAPSSPAATAPSPADARPDSRGVITYPDYQIVLARAGDTIASIAARIGLNPADLASYNGLPADWKPRAGDTLVIPPESRVAPEPPATASDSTTWSPDLVASAIDRAPPTPEEKPAAPAAPTTELAPGTEPAASDLPPARKEKVEPLRHVVEPGETIYSIARLYNVEVSAIAAWNGLGQDYTLRPGQTISIPLKDTVPAGTNPPGTAEEVAKAPPSTTDALPANPPKVEVPPSPQLSRYRSDSETPARLQRPVEGQVVRPYVASGPGRNDGIEIAAASGTPVLAADDGEVALISNSLGSLGKIVLIRHADGLTTVYGRIDPVVVRRGESVRRGQVIGNVAPASNPTLHFEVRKGAESVDPAGYL
ncbi:MAG: LysM peptidoglycan-binding domain-containing protein [Alphaproteobacteria bacterium]|nr:MAG: LysM peptidoglycan-binding domain-containing protein [Alphaproteobacteria bacterium]